MHLSKEQTVHRIIERIEEQQRRIQEEHAKRQRGEPYLTEDQVRVEVAIKYLQLNIHQPEGRSAQAFRSGLPRHLRLVSALVH